MIGLLVRLLTGTSAAGAFGPWILLGSVVAIGGAGFAAGDQFRGITDAPALSASQKETADAKLATQQCVATHEKGRADGAEQVIGALVTNAQQASAIVADLARTAAARKQSLEQVLKEIANAPSSKLCGGSAAELAFRRSVQQPATIPATP